MFVCVCVLLPFLSVCGLWLIVCFMCGLFVCVVFVCGMRLCVFCEGFACFMFKVCSCVLCVRYNVTLSFVFV